MRQLFGKLLMYGKQACDGVIKLLFILKLLVIYVDHTHTYFSKFDRIKTRGYP